MSQHGAITAKVRSRVLLVILGAARLVALGPARVLAAPRLRPSALEVLPQGGPQPLLAPRRGFFTFGHDHAPSRNSTIHRMVQASITHRTAAARGNQNSDRNG